MTNHDTTITHDWWMGVNRDHLRSNGSLMPAVMVGDTLDKFHTILVNAEAHEDFVNAVLGSVMAGLCTGQQVWVCMDSFVHTYKAEDLDKPLVMPSQHPDRRECLITYHITLEGVSTKAEIYERDNDDQPMRFETHHYPSDENVGGTFGDGFREAIELAGASIEKAGSNMPPELLTTMAQQFHGQVILQAVGYKPPEIDRTKAAMRDLSGLSRDQLGETFNELFDEVAWRERMSKESEALDG